MSAQFAACSADNGTIIGNQTVHGNNATVVGRDSTLMGAAALAQSFVVSSTIIGGIADVVGTVAAVLAWLG